MAYADIVFLQEGVQEDTQWAVDVLYNNEGIISYGVTEESLAATLEYLKQWEYGEEAVTDRDPWGTSDDVFHIGEYVITANNGLGYVGLLRKV